MRSLQFIRTIAALSVVALTSNGCGGAGFDPQDKIKGLRVLALQKDNPYPNPGDQVNIKLLYWDGKAQEGSPRKINVQALGCINPKADLYFNCAEQLLAGRGFAFTPVSNDVDAPPEEGGTEAGTTDASDLGDGSDSGDLAPSEGGLLPYEADHTRRFTFKVPEVDAAQQPIIRPKAPGTPPYGLVYILFAVCAGELKLGVPAVPNGLPLSCTDASGVLGPDDFVPGYSALYVYGDRHNKNPVIGDFLLDQASLRGSPGRSDSDIRHIPRCVGGSCAKHDLKLALDQKANQEEDPGSIGRDGQVLQEQMWLSFYTTAGSFDHPLRLVNDASQGWNEDDGSKFTAPAEPGPVHLWGVVHDNRGGVAWVEGKIIVD